MDDSSEGSNATEASGAAARRSLLDRLGSDPPPGSTREQFWSTVCRFAPFFYVMLLVVTVFLVMNTVVLALVPGASLAPRTELGSLVIIGLNFVLLGGVALGIGYVLWRCDRLSTSG